MQKRKETYLLPVFKTDIRPLIDAAIRHPLYQTWRQMISRCHNKDQARYASYGGRGIYVDERWHNPLNFIADMGMRPTPKHQIDRIDNDGPYPPENCRWVTCKENTNNRSVTAKVKYKDRVMTVKEASEISGIKYETLLRRVKAAWADPFAPLQKRKKGNAK